MNGNHGDSVWAQAGLTARRTCRADAKAEPSEPTLRIRCGGRLSDKSYSRDNRLVPPKSSYRRRSSAPRCRLTTSWGWRSSQRFGCSPIKVVRELGSDRWAINWSEEHHVCNVINWLFDSLNHFENFSFYETSMGSRSINHGGLISWKLKMQNAKLNATKQGQADLYRKSPFKEDDSEGRINLKS